MTRARPWIAAVLSLIMTGLGQVWLGAFALGLALYAVTLGATVAGAFILARTEAGLGGLGAVVALGGAPYIYSIVEAFRRGRRPFGVPHASESQRTGGAAGPGKRVCEREPTHGEGPAPGGPPAAVRVGLVLALLVPISVGPALVQAHIVDVHAVGGEAMSPAFAPGEIVLVDRSAAGTQPARGEVVLVPVPRAASDGRPEPYVARRVVGLPGETVEVREDRALVNDRPLDEPYATTGTAAARVSVRFTLQEGQVLVLADNRPRGMDSRQWGPVAIARIGGRVKRLPR